MAAVESSTSRISENWLNKAQEGSSNMTAEGTGSAAKSAFKPTAGLSFGPGGTTSSAPTKPSSASKQQSPSPASAPAPKTKTAPDQVPPFVKQHLDEAVEAWHAYEKAGVDDVVDADEKMREAYDRLEDDIRSTIIDLCNGQCTFNSAQKAAAKLERAVLNDARQLKTKAAVIKERQETVHGAIEPVLLDIAGDSLINARDSNRRAIIQQFVSWIAKEEKEQKSEILYSSGFMTNLWADANAKGFSTEKWDKLIKDLKTELAKEEKRQRINPDDLLYLPKIQVF